MDNYQTLDDQYNDYQSFYQQYTNKKTSVKSHVILSQPYAETQLEPIYSSLESLSQSLYSLPIHRLSTKTLTPSKFISVTSSSIESLGSPIPSSSSSPIDSSSSPSSSSSSSSIDSSSSLSSIDSSSSPSSSSSSSSSSPMDSSSSPSPIDSSSSPSSSSPMDSSSSHNPTVVQHSPALVDTANEPTNLTELLNKIPKYPYEHKNNQVVPKLLQRK